MYESFISRTQYHPVLTAPHLVWTPCNLQVVEISLYEVGLYSTFFLERDKMQRIDILHACLTSVKKFFDTHFNVESSFEASISYSKWMQSGYALLMGFKLCLCSAEGWDLQYVREVLNFPLHLNELIRKLKIEVSRAQTINSHQSDAKKPEIFARYLRQLRHVRDWYDSTLPETLHIQTPPKTPHFIPHRLQFTQRNNTITIPAPPTEGMYEDMLMNLDNDFWNSVYSNNDDWMTAGSEFWKTSSTTLSEGVDFLNPLCQSRTPKG